MDVDPPLPHTSLKRCCSAPMIAECDSDKIAASQPDAAASTDPVVTAEMSGDSNLMSCSPFEPRTRRFSASFSPLNSPATPGSPRVPRVNQLKKEGARDVAGREAASEKDFQSTLQISASWEDLTLSDTDSKECKAEFQRRPSSACTEPIHVSLPNGLSPFVSSPYPSPTRVSGRQCFSPSMQIPVRNSSFSPTPSPSPTRKTFYTSRRSLSPIAIRASPLGPVKRKCDLDERGDTGWIPQKKYQHFSPAANHWGGSLLVTQSTSAEAVDGSGGSSTRCVIPTPDSLSVSSTDSGSTPSPLQICKIGESPGNSPVHRRGSVTTMGDAGNCGSRSRDRSVCVVPSPLASTVLDGDSLCKSTQLSQSFQSKERKDFSRLFVPIPPSPGAMDFFTADVEDSVTNSEFPSRPRPLKQSSLESCREFADSPMDENIMIVEDSAVVSSQEQSMSVDSSHSPMDPSV